MTVGTERVWHIRILHFGTGTGMAYLYKGYLFFHFPFFCIFVWNKILQSPQREKVSWELACYFVSSPWTELFRSLGSYFCHPISLSGVFLLAFLLFQRFLLLFSFVSISPASSLEDLASYSMIFSFFCRFFIAEIILLTSIGALNSKPVWSIWKQEDAKVALLLLYRCQFCFTYPYTIASYVQHPLATTVAMSKVA